MTDLRVIHTVNSLRAEHGGPSRSITALARATIAQGANVRVVTHGDDPVQSPRRPNDVAVDLVLRQTIRELTGRRSAVGRRLDELAHPHTILHDHGLWLPINRAVASFARHTRTPRIVSIRGMLSDWAILQSKWRKRAAWTVYQKNDLSRSEVIHATSEMELAEVRSRGIRTAVAVLPNGVDLPDETPIPDGRGKRVLFLSRIHPKKGVVYLLDAWRAILPPNWTLIVAGPGEDELTVGALSHAAMRDDSIEIVGAVDDEEKWALYRSADLFVLPTLSENFGIVVAEALAAGVPVITTKAAPWQELEAHRCGWWIDTGTSPLVEALRHAMSLSVDERRAMGARGRALVEANYSWDRIAQEMIEVYEWLLGRRSRPDCVYD